LGEGREGGRNEQESKKLKVKASNQLNLKAMSDDIMNFDLPVERSSIIKC